MKKFITTFVPWILIVAMVAVMFPALLNRAENESENKHITVSLLYNNLYNSVSPQKREQIIDRAKKAGINTVSVMEEDVNSMVARGEVTCIKLNVLLHKYDEESMIMGQQIIDNYPNISYDTYLLMTRRPETSEKIDKFIGMKYTKDQFFKLDKVEGIDVYAFQDGRQVLWDISLGYDEALISDIYDRGFEIALVHTVRNSEEQGYLDYIDALVKKYDIEYFNIKKANGTVLPDDEISENYEGIIDIVNGNNMTLVVTENSDQLSNQQTLGYKKIFDAVYSEDGTRKVMRSYETYDDSHADITHYKYRVNQYYNSTIDRNIRFITVTQQTPEGLTFEECADYTIKAAEDYIKRITNDGYIVNSTEERQPIEYPNPSRTVSGCAAVVMVMLVLIAAGMLIEKNYLWLTVAGLVAAAGAFGITFVLPSSLVHLYPSLYCIVCACFAMTVVLKYVKDLKSTVKIIPAILSTAAIVLAILCTTMVGMGAMLSGMDYYINNEIFRGIKISLMVPPVYTIAAFFVMYMRDESTGFFTLENIKKIATADIKIYYIFIVAFVGLIGFYYIKRSGNVNTISFIEQWMRDLITEIFPARPRTKEFIIGYPSLVLFVYYVRKTNYKLIQWLFAAGTSILAASITNSFCHVFTNITTIYMRVVNGLIVGAILAVIAYIGNLVLLKLFEMVKEKVLNMLEKANV